MSTFRGRKKAIGIDGPVLAASMSINVLSLVLPIAILQVFDRVIPFQSAATLQMLTLALILGAVLELVFRWSRSVLLSAAAEQAAVENHRSFISTVMNANGVAFSASSTAVYLERFAAISRLRDYYSGQNQTLAIDLPFTAVFVVMIGLIGGWLVLVPLGCLLCVLVSASLLKKIQAPIFDRRKSLDGRRYTFLAEVLASMPTVKANTLERQLTRRFELLADQTVDTSRSLILFSGLSQSYGAAFSQSAVAAMGLFGAFLVILGKIGIAELAACMLLNGRIVQPLMKLMTIWVQSETVESAKSKLADMEAIPSATIRACERQPVCGVIEAKNLSLGHTVTGKAGIQNVSFRVEAGQIVLLDGDDNSTIKNFFDTILGQQLPQAGALMVDGYVAVDRLAQRGRNGIVSLEDAPAIFAGTVLDNISAFGDGAQVERARHIALQLGLEKRIHRLPQGFNTLLNSGGIFENDPINRQLISLTRALSLQPKILLMDEPSAILEAPEREALSACLVNLNPRPTILMYSPDPSLKRIAQAHLDLGMKQNLEIDAWLHDAQQEKAVAPQPQNRGAA